MRVLVIVLALAAVAAPARADDLPPSRLSLLGALRHGTGQVSSSIGYGESVGIEASWQPMAVGQRLGWGVAWSLLWSWFGDQPAARITGSLDTLELDLALRVRFAPTPSPGRVLTIGIGGMLLRSNERLPPDDDRAYLGPFGEIGYEHLAWGAVTATIHVRLGPVGTGPTLASAVLGIGVAL